MVPVPLKEPTSGRSRSQCEALHLSESLADGERPGLSSDIESRMYLAFLARSHFPRRSESGWVGPHPAGHTQKLALVNEGSRRTQVNKDGRCRIRRRRRAASLPGPARSVRLAGRPWSAGSRPVDYGPLLSSARGGTHGRRVTASRSRREATLLPPHRGRAAPRAACGRSEASRNPASAAAAAAVARLPTHPPSWTLQGPTGLARRARWAGGRRS
jgi:hypothetical protein